MTAPRTRRKPRKHTPPLVLEKGPWRVTFNFDVGYLCNFSMALGECHLVRFDQLKRLTPEALAAFYRARGYVEPVAAAKPAAILPFPALPSGAVARKAA